MKRVLKSVGFVALCIVFFGLFIFIMSRMNGSIEVPVPEGIVFNCPQGTRMTAANLGEYFPGHPESICVFCAKEEDTNTHNGTYLNISVTRVRPVKQEMWIDGRTNQVLAVTTFNEDESINERIYYAHDTLTSKFFTGACGGVRIMSGYWHTFENPCPCGQAPPTQYPGTSAKNVILTKS